MTVERAHGKDLRIVRVERTHGKDLLAVRIERLDGRPGGYSVTGKMYLAHGGDSGTARRARGKDPDVSGAIHDEILGWIPELAPVVAVHLADIDGTPMHALVNGWYFYSGAASDYERRMIDQGRDYGYSKMLERPDHERAADALHVSPEDLSRGMNREQFTAYVASLAPHWSAMAKAADAVIESLS